MENINNGHDAALTKAVLQLEDGSLFEGISFGAEHDVSGECVFQTGMVGYVESLTDPSYRGQLLVLTFPLIGNYGVPDTEKVDPQTGIPLFVESNQIHVSALLVADYTWNEPSHWNAVKSLSTWLKENKVPALYGLDTRAITKRIRDKGSMLGRIIFNRISGPIPLSPSLFVDPNQINLVNEVSTKSVAVYGSSSADKTIIAIDCGMKWNQVRCLVSRGVRVKVVPWNHDFTNEKDFDGVFISNGPGDPTKCAETITQLQGLLKREKIVPIFGICLGHQLLGLAAGGKTYKMKFGNRGHNQPCVDLQTGRCHLTSQNHGFAFETETLPQDWEPFFVNANDQTNEGIRHKTKPFFSVQFHPEAKGGPTETEYLFDKFLADVRGVSFQHPLASEQSIPHPGKITKILILGSGGLSIGQAGEFDYSGSQAIKAFKEEGVQTVLINPNIATVQTTGLADKVYFLPVTPEYVTRVIELEKPDGIVVTFGGQTALNCGIELFKRNTFNRFNVQVLGTPISAIIATEDREIFANKMAEIGEKVAQSEAVRTLSEAIVVANKIKYPVIVRAAYALGGLGSGFAADDAQLTDLVTKALAVTEQVLIERSMKGWKEVEYEVVRDRKDNCITVTNMENFDPLGIHTGESIVVAPSQTLTDAEYHMLRTVSIKVIRHIGVVGK
jgi:carbamoyl-phosphate synthase small subunit